MRFGKIKKINNFLHLKFGQFKNKLYLCNVKSKR